MSETAPEPVKRGPGRPPRAVGQATIPVDAVEVRITKMGHHKVFTGHTPAHRRPEMDDEFGDPKDKHWFPTYPKDTVVSLPRNVALALEDKGFAEIQE